MPGFFRKHKVAQASPVVRCAAIVAAAGQGSRMGGGGKALLPIGDLPMIAHSLLALEQAESIEEIIVAARPEDIIEIAALCRDLEIGKVRHIIKGGDDRVTSVLTALSNVSKGITHAAVHDGARPCLRPALCDRVVRAAAESGAAIPCIPIADTVKAVADNGVISRTADRSVFRLAQTPQCFALELLKGALSEVLRLGLTVTDDSAALERIGLPVTAVVGDSRNIKVTTPEDLMLAAALLSLRYAENGDFSCT